MEHRILYKLGTLVVSLEAYSSMKIWEIPLWKLDPYRIIDSKESPDLSIPLNSTEKQIQPGKLLNKERAGFFQHIIYNVPGGMIWQYERIKNHDLQLRYYISSKWDQIQLLEDHSHTDGHLAFEYLGQIMPSVMLRHCILTFHGVLLEYEGNGIIISAPSGTGKTTHARMWRDLRRALIINGDRAACRKINGTWTGFGLPWSGTSGEQVNRSVPIKAMIILERSEENQAFQISGMDAFISAWTNVLKPGWDTDLSGKALDLTDDFLQTVPVVRLRCRRDADSVEVLSNFLEGIG